MDDYTQYDEYTRSGHKAVEHFLNEEPHLSFKALKEKLHRANISLKDQTIRNYMTNWRLYSKNGAVPRLHFGLGLLDSGFDAALWRRALCCGWNESKNRNRERWRAVSGVSLAWSRTGTVRFHFKGSMPENYLLSAFSIAFCDILRTTGKSDREISDYLRTLFKEHYRQVAVHLTYETGQPLPKMTIVDKGLGETIKLGDSSHPTAVERELTAPFWLSRFTATVDKFGEEIHSHMELIKTWKEENDSQRRKQRDHFDDANVVRITKIAEPQQGWCIRCLQKKMLSYSADSVNSSDRICEDCAKALFEKLQRRSGSP